MQLYLSLSYKFPQSIYFNSPFDFRRLVHLEHTVVAEATTQVQSLVLIFHPFLFRKNCPARHEHCFSVNIDNIQNSTHLLPKSMYLKISYTSVTFFFCISFACRYVPSSSERHTDPLLSKNKRFRLTMKSRSFMLTKIDF